jgi:hypothetical protein
MTAAHTDPRQTLITAAQLALRWSLSVETLAQWRAAGSGPPWVRIGDGQRPRVRYRMSDVIAYERKQESA